MLFVYVYVRTYNRLCNIYLSTTLHSVYAAVAKNLIMISLIAHLERKERVGTEIIPSFLSMRMFCT